MLSHVSLCGPCEWCGGPQSWTIIAGVVYTSCDGGCLPLPLEGLVPPPDSPELKKPVTEETPNGTLQGGGGSSTYEGDEARTDVPKNSELPF